MAVSLALVEAYSIYNATILLEVSVPYEAWIAGVTNQPSDNQTTSDGVGIGASVGYFVYLQNTSSYHLTM